MQKVKNQHPAICWAIDVTQISREGVLGRPDPAIGKGLIGSLQVLLFHLLGQNLKQPLFGGLDGLLPGGHHHGHAAHRSPPNTSAPLSA
ncbi:hypothetical protein [uncultured Marinobacter sp.]|uniref:hypothetical protein n=1 Tax=uncultured Marinobacter sp. TaxID=187379 RepID=UPI00338D47B2